MISRYTILLNKNTRETKVVLIVLSLIKIAFFYWTSLHLHRVRVFIILERDGSRKGPRTEGPRFLINAKKAEVTFTSASFSEYPRFLRFVAFLRPA